MYGTATLLLLLLFILVIESHSLLLTEHKRWKKRVKVRDGWTTVRPVRPTNNNKEVRKIIVIPLIFACAFISVQQIAAADSLVCSYFSDFDDNADDIFG